VTKKILVEAVTVLFGLCSIAAFAGEEEIVDWSVGDVEAKITQDGTNATLTVDKAVITSGTVAGRTPIVSSSASAYSMLQSGTKAATGLSVTQAFSVVYSAAPVVIYRYTGADMPATNAVTIASNQFIVVGAQTNFDWIAVGAKP